MKSLILAPGHFFVPGAGSAARPVFGSTFSAPFVVPEGNPASYDGVPQGGSPGTAVEEPRFKDASAEMMIIQLRLGQAEGRIALTERHITNQQLLIDRLRADGRDTEAAEEVLRGFEKNLEALYELRQLIIKTIEQIDNGLV